MWRLDTAHEMIPPACDGGEKDAGKRSSNGDPTEPTTLHRYRLDGVCKRVLEPTANSTPLVPQMRGMPLPAGQTISTNLQPARCKNGCS